MDAFDPKHPSALAVYCSDGRFTRAVEALLRSLGQSRLDTLTMPGGPALLALETARPSDRDSVGRAASFLIHGHHIKHVVLIAHEGCGYYRDRYPSRAAEAILALQRADLRGAARALVTAHPRLAIEGYLAQVRDARITFAPALD
jgi:hypothetical protein